MVDAVEDALARPSQKLRTLKTALITDGVLRGATWRMFAAADAEALGSSRSPRMMDALRGHGVVAVGAIARPADERVRRAGGTESPQRQLLVGRRRR